MLLQLQQQLLENCESQVCKCLQRIKKLAKNCTELVAHSLSSSSHTLSYKAAAPIFLLLNLLVFYFTGFTIFYLSLTSFDSWPFFFCTLFLLLFHSFSFFSVRSSFSLTSFRFRNLSGVTPLAPLLPDFSFTLHFVYPFLSTSVRLLSMPSSHRCVR